MCLFLAGLVLVDEVVYNLDGGHEGRRVGLVLLPVQHEGHVVQRSNRQCSTVRYYVTANLFIADRLMSP